MCSRFGKLPARSDLHLGGRSAWRLRVHLRFRRSGPLGGYVTGDTFFTVMVCVGKSAVKHGDRRNFAGFQNPDHSSAFLWCSRFYRGVRHWRFAGRRRIEFLPSRTRPPEHPVILRHRDRSLTGAETVIHIEKHGISTRPAHLRKTIHSIHETDA